MSSEHKDELYMMNKKLHHLGGDRVLLAEISLALELLIRMKFMSSWGAVYHNLAVERFLPANLLFLCCEKGG